MIKTANKYFNLNLLSNLKRSKKSRSLTRIFWVLTLPSKKQILCKYIHSLIFCHLKNMTFPLLEAAKHATLKQTILRLSEYIIRSATTQSSNATFADSMLTIKKKSRYTWKHLTPSRKTFTANIVHKNSRRFYRRFYLHDVYFTIFLILAPLAQSPHQAETYRKRTIAFV